jgi:maleate isomerase
MKRTLLGMLTPSSNTALEPLTSAMVSGLPRVSAHFSRFRVTEISLEGAALGQFDEAPILEAARLLADARVDVICWSGTSSGWLGFDRDLRLCESIRAATGIQACTSVLALNEILGETGARSFGLVTPYLDDVQQAILANYRKSGYDCVAEQHLNQSVNFAFSEIALERIGDLVREVARARPQAIATFCTNMRAAAIVPALERELGIPIYDTVSTAVWKSLKLAGVDPRGVKGWGRLFEEVP